MSDGMTGTFAEAPASFNVRMQSPDGFDCMLTLRATSGAELLPKVGQVIEWAKANGYKPTVNGYGRNGHGNGHTTPKPEADGDALTDEKGKRYRVCEIHQARMYAKTGKDGQTWYSHQLADGTWCKGK